MASGKRWQPRMTDNGPSKFWNFTENDSKFTQSELLII